MLLAVYYSLTGAYEQALRELFAALEEIQSVIELKELAEGGGFSEREELRQVSLEETEWMLNEAKFNIILATLLQQVLLYPLRAMGRQQCSSRTSSRKPRTQK